MVAAISSLVARSGVIGGGGIEEQYKFVALKPTPPKKEGGREGGSLCICNCMEKAT